MNKIITIIALGANFAIIADYVTGLHIAGTTYDVSHQAGSQKAVEQLEQEVINSQKTLDDYQKEVASLPASSRASDAKQIQEKLNLLNVDLQQRKAWLNLAKQQTAENVVGTQLSPNISVK